MIQPFPNPTSFPKGLNLKCISLVCDVPTRIAKAAIKHLERWFNEKTKPSNDRLTFGAAFDLKRSKRKLRAENALLRQQLIVLKRQTNHPQATQRSH
jgi:hypothetical protein